MSIKNFSIILLLSLLVLDVRAENLSALTAENLIDRLTLLDAPAPGLHGGAISSGFIGSDEPQQFSGGIIGAEQPQVPPAMRELVRRGVSALPALIAHLHDRRPTKFAVGDQGFFTWRVFSNEYGDYNIKYKKDFAGAYTVKVGDVCYAIIGQIVDRPYTPVRYQPTAGLVVNSPLEAPELIEWLRRDWGRLDADGHRAILVSHALGTRNPRQVSAALERLRFYYPAEYAKQAADGELREAIKIFTTEKNNRK
ncbi:MAG: hypothetical protein LBK76_11935 [Verrucomicrobiales bacterium]|nr:hypothetical protein [Verrucomicrobiales bacterium]